MNRKLLRATVAICAFLGAIAFASAHPVPRDNHDRFLLVSLTPNAVVVDYRLEVDESRAALDLPKSEQKKINSRDDLYNTFTRYFGDILAGNLVAYLDGEALDFKCVERRYTFRDELDQPLGHLRCDFRMEAAWKPTPDGKHTFTFRESNYELEDFDSVQVRLAAGETLPLTNVIAPDEKLLARKPADFLPGDGERVRKLSATFTMTQAETPTGSVTLTENKVPPEKREDAHPSSSLLDLLLNTDQGVAMLLLLAFAFGGVHALTPGHGKTLVAAYLVGERGTVWHAVLLGCVTTITHTGAVILIATALIFFPNTDRAAVQTYLELLGGLLVLGLGIWLLYTRLAGRADHFHFHGGHHHHHDHDHDHDHSHVAVLPTSVAEKPSVWALAILGFKGGMVPCWDAIVLLLFAISKGCMGRGLPLLLAFSAGLAAVLTGLGVSVVHARNFAGKRWSQGERFQRVFRALPLVSAITVTLMGLWLCYDSVHPK
jgi:nickel/cobalt exporter